MFLALFSPELTPGRSLVAGELTQTVKPYLWGVEVQFNPDIVAKLSRLAADRGSDAELPARESIERFVDYDEWFLREWKGHCFRPSGRVAFP